MGDPVSTDDRLSFKDVTAYLEKGYVMIGDSQDELVLSEAEAAALCDWLVKVLNVPTDETVTPQFMHDCEHCKFLGRHVGERGNYDLYHCIQTGYVPTLVARWGNAGPEYKGGMHVADPEIREAMKRARERGLPCG